MRRRTVPLVAARSRTSQPTARANWLRRARSRLATPRIEPAVGRRLGGLVVAVLAAGVVGAVAKPPADDGSLGRAETAPVLDVQAAAFTPTSAPSIGTIALADAVPEQVRLEMPTLDPVDAAALRAETTPLGGSYTELIEAYFGPVAVEAITIVQCESQFIPWAVGTNSDGTQDHGLFQINDVHAPAFPLVTGVDWELGRYDPVANTAFARWLYGHHDGWKAWTCADRLDEPS